MPSYPSRRFPHLRNYDYAQAGAYFATLCTENRRCLLGIVNDGEVHLSSVGDLVQQNLQTLGDRFPHITIDAFVVMPNHVHLIMFIDGPATDRDRIPLGEVIRRFKTYTATRFRTLEACDGQALWQRNYHERVIRNERQLDAVRAYIANNARQWELDEENPARKR